MANSLGLIFCAVLFMFVQDWAFGDSGSLTSCGGSKFQFSWSPRVLIADDTYTFQVDGTANMDFEKGKLHAVVKALPDTTLFNETQDFDCADIPKEFPVKIPCPVERGQSMKGTYKYKLPDEFGVVPAGDYLVYADLRNDQGQQFVCVKGTITVAYP